MDATRLGCVVQRATSTLRTQAGAAGRRADLRRFDRATNGAEFGYSYTGVEDKGMAIRFPTDRSPR